jgi:hypothetical protein
MSNTLIKLKKSSVSGKTPLVGDLQYGELALNYADGIIYYKAADNRILKFVDSDNITLRILDLVDSGYVAARGGATIPVYNDDGSFRYDQAVRFTLNTNASGEATLQPRLSYLDSASNEIVIDLPVSTGGFSDSSTVINLIDSAYVQARQITYSIPTFGTDYVDSSEVIRLITENAIDSALALQLLLDSSEIVSLIDSAYVQARQQLVDSASIINLVDSAYVQARQQLVDSASIIQLVDADYIRERQQLVDSASIIQLVDSDYVQARQAGGEIGSYASVAVSNHVGDSSTVDFTLPATPASEGQVIVAINGVLQSASTYTVVGNVVTLDSAPETGDVIDTRVINNQLANVQLRDHQTYVYTPSTPTTVITGADDNGNTLLYDIGKVSAYLNGAKLVSGLDYTETNISTITLASSIDSGDTLEIESFAKAALTSYGIFSKDSDFVTTDSDQVIYTFPKSQFRTVKMVVQMEDDTNTRYHSEEVLLSHNGSQAYITTYAQLLMDSNLGSIDADISGNNVRILFSPTYANTSVKLRMIRVDA